MSVQESYGTTLGQMRKRLGIDLGDMIPLTATSTGETTRFNDEDRLLRPNYDGRIIYFPDGPNQGQQRVIPQNGGGVGYLTWGRPIIQAPQLGDVAELWNINGIGFHPELVNNHLRNAHAKVLEYAQIPLADPAESVYGYDQRVIAIPDDYREINGVQWQHRTGEWKSVPRASRPGAPGYWVNKATREIEIDGAYRHYMDTQAYRILGRGREHPLVDEDDVTVSNAEWIIAEAGRTLLMANLHDSADSRFLQQKLAEYSRESEMKRGRARGRQDTSVDLVV